MARSTCGKTGKQIYDSYFHAKAAARTIKDATAEDHGYPYRCDACGRWHLGRPQP